ncbi:hypothetical protein NP233_g5429 [Leucocoprinus birnbaumii]|uniref:CAP N-terminal domain-containing protein n=1 Tax=Leucocoprinus birnbaumii TaxID=56174 RepID=A0AAD5VU51_9AGAR|nr:hypothetical protein NP233_g5429 [Leucocoprinus birnbaumii]
MASSQGLYSLATIIKRLEAATSRLEDIATSQSTSGPAPATASSTASTPVNCGASSAPSPASTTSTTSCRCFVAAKITPWVELSKSLNVPLINEIATLVSKEYDELRNFLVLVGSCQKPDQETFQELLSPIQKAIEAFSKAKDSYRRERESFGHLQFASEAAVAVGWVVNDRPAQYVKDVKESSEYYGNRVMKDFKDK